MLHDLLPGLPQGLRLCGGVVIAAHLDRGDDGLVARNRKALLEADLACDRAEVTL